jgi:hypothetical protein
MLKKMIYMSWKTRKKALETWSINQISILWSEGPLDLDLDGKRERDVWETDILSSLQRKLGDDV